MILASFPALPLADTFYMIGAVMAGTSATVIFVMREFSNTRKMMYQGQVKLQKLFFRVISQHNKEDDDRFEAIYREQYRLHVRNAKKDGTPMPEFRPLPKRSYLIEHGGDVDLDALDEVAATIDPLDQAG